jgi:hypothetical protein
MNKLKDPTQSFEEMMERNRMSKLHQAAYSFWRDSNYAYNEYYDRFKRFSRWFDPSWSLPPHVQAISDLYSKYFISHKIIPTDYGQGVQMHLNPSNVPENPQNWKRWRSWSYTACIPFSLEDLDKWDPIPIRYTEYYNLPELDYNPCSYDGSKFKTMYCRPFERMSFASSHIAHEVLPANNRCFWILHDLTFEDGVLPHTNIKSDVVENLADMQKDILEIIGAKKEDGTPYFKRQFMSDLDYFLSFNKPVNDFDWMPSNL